jgi:arylsulfatase A-like enzyme
MGKVRNILFVMCDQLRWDYLSCAGHPTLATPNIDRLAARGVRFDRAFVQAPVCGPSRMSYYTGRYVASHRAVWNFVPLPVGELTLGDYLRPAGLRVALAGKTHMEPDRTGMGRLGLSAETPPGLYVAEAGFEPYDRDDGIWPHLFGKRVATRYCEYLRARGYPGDNPWHDHANSAAGPNGEVLSGWEMRHAGLPARVREEDSETPYMTGRAIEFIADQGEKPWCLHLSYIKPHWPYIVPAPYHAMYAPDAVVPPVRAPRERERPHPVVGAFMKHRESVAFSEDEVRATVIPTYMGLVKQIDDQIGRLVAALERHRRLDDTLILFTSDHGDYLGDHWLGEKELFHEASARVPMIVVDPDAAADATRGTVSRALVEAIDVVPTCLDAVGVARPNHVLEGRSLLPLVRGGDAADWRETAFSEFDYSFREARLALGRPVHACRTFMARTERWKYIRYEGYPPQLFDLLNDPFEFVDLGEDAGYAAVRAEMAERMFGWLRGLNIRQTTPDEVAGGWAEKAERGGIRIGLW